MIVGVTLKDLTTHVDERGELTELLSTNFGDQDLCHIYRCMVRPGAVKAFHCHLKQTDRFTPIAGVTKVGMVDLRGSVRGDAAESTFGSGRWKYMAQRWEDRADVDGDFNQLWPCDRERYDSFGGYSETFLEQQTAILDASRPQVLTIPPGVAHGIMSLSPEGSEILNAPTRAYNREAPDELRLPFDSFGYKWEVQSG